MGGGWGGRRPEGVNKWEWAKNFGHFVSVISWWTLSTFLLILHHLWIMNVIKFLSPSPFPLFGLEFSFLWYIVSLNWRYDLYLSFEESIFGGQREIEVPCFETCDNCGGTGAKSSSCIKSCVDCGGRGGVLKTQRTPFGMMSQVIWHVTRCLVIA